MRYKYASLIIQFNILIRHYYCKLVDKVRPSTVAVIELYALQRVVNWCWMWCKQCCSPRGPIYKSLSLSLNPVHGPQVLVLGPQNHFTFCKLSVTYWYMSAIKAILHCNPVLLSLRKVLVLEDQFTSPCPCSRDISPWIQHWMQVHGTA